MMKTLKKLVIEGNFLNLLKRMHGKPTANIILNGVRVNILHLISGKQQGCTLFTLLFNIVLAVLGKAIEQKKERNDICIRKKGVKLSLFSGDIIKYVEILKESTLNY